MARVNAIGTGYEQEDVDEIVRPLTSLVNKAWVSFL